MQRRLEENLNLNLNSFISITPDRHRTPMLYSFYIETFSFSSRKKSLDNDDNETTIARREREKEQQQKVYSILLIHLTLNILQIKMSTHIRSARAIATVERAGVCLLLLFVLDSAFRHSLFSLLSICYEKRVNIQSDGEPRAVFISFLAFFSCKRKVSLVKMFCRTKSALGLD